MKVYYKCNSFMVQALDGDPVALLSKKNKLPAIDVQFKMIKRLRSLFPHREVDFNFGRVDDHFCIMLKSGLVKL